MQKTGGQDSCFLCLSVRGCNVANDTHGLASPICWVALAAGSVCRYSGRGLPLWGHSNWPRLRVLVVTGPISGGGGGKGREGRDSGWSWRWLVPSGGSVGG